MKFIDLFAGIGGFRLGFERQGFKCVFSCEIDKHCSKVYYENFREIPNGDITKIKACHMPDFDILLAGFPCQPFSISGKKMGFDDTRGTLFFDVCRIIKEKKPPIIVLENVKHLIYHDKGHTLQVILSSLSQLGYKVNYKILNAKDFGIPQNRERIFIICQKESYFNFDKLKHMPHCKLRDVLDKKGTFQFLNKEEYTLIDKPTRQSSGLIFVGYRNKKIRIRGVRPNTEHLSRVHKQPNRIYSVDGVHPTLPSQETSGRFFIYFPEKDLVRKLTLDECYRLMGFPDNFKKITVNGAAYKQIGNSVCVTLVEEIAKVIKYQNNMEFYESQTKTNRNIQLFLFN